MQSSALVFLLVSSLRGAKTRRGVPSFGRSGLAGSLEIPVMTGLDERSPRRKVQEHQGADRSYLRDTRRSQWRWHTRIRHGSLLLPGTEDRHGPDSASCAQGSESVVSRALRHGITLVAGSMGGYAFSYQSTFDWANRVSPKRNTVTV